MTGATAAALLRSLGLRQRLGLAIVALALGVQAVAGWQALADLPAVRAAFWGGMLAALATTTGALPVLWSRQLPRRVHDTMLGFGGGVMLAASAFSLVVPGIAAARAAGAGAWHAGGIIGMAMLLGALLLIALDRYWPHGVPALAEPRDARALALRRAWMFVFAITLHNLPEGLAIGVAYAGTDALRAGALATGIAVQDLPEGFVVALALIGVGYSRPMALLGALASGLVEPAGAVLGAAVVSVSAAALPWGLGLAAGAMVYVVAHDVIPESQRHGRAAWASYGLVFGFVLMMLLDTALA